MVVKHPKKIHIIGSVGSGKSTLANLLSEKLAIPCYELDSFVWKRIQSGDVKNSRKERERLFQSVLKTDSWIVEGVQYSWVSNSFDQSDIIIYLDTSMWKRTHWNLKRFLLEKIGVEKNRDKQTIRMMIQMLKWNRQYDQQTKPIVLKLLRQYQEKVLVARSPYQIEKYIGRNYWKKNIGEDTGF